MPSRSLKTRVILQRLEKLTLAEISFILRSVFANSFFTRSIDDVHLLENAIDEKESLEYRIKVLRNEVREAFDALLIDLFPRKLNE